MLTHAQDLKFAKYLKYLNSFHSESSEDPQTDYFFPWSGDKYLLSFKNTKNVGF